MPLGVSKECFPTPSKCHNCERKMTELVRKESDPKEEYKRCGNCHIMTYCDKDCQKEHWIKVHKNHCRFLSGKSPVKNSYHDAATCARCKEEREPRTSPLYSENSPKTNCSIQLVEKLMKNELSYSFGFHREGKKCGCSLEYALALPFPLGEVSGQYLEISSTGLDAMLAHALKITNAMGIKSYNNEERRNVVLDLQCCLIDERVKLWYHVLVSGKPRISLNKRLSQMVDSLNKIYDTSDPWLKTLKFSVTFVINTKDCQRSNLRDSQSLEDPKFEKLKILQDYYQSQLQKQRVVCDKKMWPNFMLWPQIVNGSLSVLLPPETHCQSCYTELSGKVAISNSEPSSQFMPFLFPNVGNDGALVACCSPSQNPKCINDCLNKDVEDRLMSDEEQWKEVLKEDDIFFIEARDCVFCLKMSLSSHRCSGCLTVQYCSTSCQKKDLDFHRTVCSTWAKDESRIIYGKGKQKKYWKKVLGEE